MKPSVLTKQNSPSFEQAKSPSPKSAILTNCGKTENQETPVKRAQKKLKRVPFTVSRLMEFCTHRELVNQTGHTAGDWPLVVLKELTDNALDACEEAEIAPVIDITVNDDSITIADNGPGIPAKTIDGILDYSIRVSSREAYCSPTRGAQGNALKTILPMGYVLDEGKGEERSSTTIIEARGLAHRIVFGVDHIRQEPKIEHNTEKSPVKTGTKVTVTLPNVHLHRWQDWAQKRFLQTCCGLRMAEPAFDSSAVLGRREQNRRRGIRPDMVEMATDVADIGALVRCQPVPALHGRPHRQSRNGHRPRIHFRVSRYDRHGQAKGSAGRDWRVTCFAAQLFRTAQGEDREHRRAARGTQEAHQAGATRRPWRHRQGPSLWSDGAGGRRSENIHLQPQLGDTGGLPRVVEFAFGIQRSGFEADNNTHESSRLVTGVNWSAAINNPFRLAGPQR